MTMWGKALKVAIEHPCFSRLMPQGKIRQRIYSRNRGRVAGRVSLCPLSHLAPSRRARPRTFFSRFALAALFAFIFAAPGLAEERPVALADAPAHPQSTRVEVDEQAGAIRIIIGGQERAIFNDAGLHVSGSIDYTGTITDLSDRAYKEDIQSLSGQSAKIGALKPVTFGMTNDPTGRTEYGLIAQEVEPLYPALVQTRAGGVKAVNYTGLIAPLIATVQELKADNARLRARLEALEARSSHAHAGAEAR